MLLAIIMLISIVPVTAMAAEHTHVDDNGNGTCDVSGCSEHVHMAAATLSKDDTGHFYRCKFGTCGNAKLTDTEAHDYTTCIPAGDVNHQGTCGDCGYQKLLAHVDEDKDCKCDDCGHPLKHDFEIIEPTAKTCTTDGVLKHAKCKVCGALYTYDGVTPITEAHIIDKAPQHSAYTQWLNDETGHWHMCRNEALNCEEKLEFAAHTPSEWRVYPSNKAQHYQYCTVCTMTLTTADHNYVYTAKDYGTDTHKIECADCNLEPSVQSCTDGNGDCKCDQCGALMASVHASGLTYVKKVEAKCEETGMESHYKCEKCGTLFGDSQGKNIATTEILIIKKLGHDHSKGWLKDETGHWHECKNTGCDDKVDFSAHNPGKCIVYPSDPTKHFQLCTDCNQSTNIEPHEYEVTAKAYGAGTHTLTCKDCGTATAQTCVDGNKDCKCDICEALLGHERAGLTYHAYKAATCLADGHHGYMTCDNCGTSFKNEKDSNGFYIPGESFTIGALGHDWGTVGETINGKHQQKCTRCGLYRAVPHEDTDGDCACDINGCGIILHSHTLMTMPEKAPTCTEAGTESYLKYEGCDKMFDLDRKPITAPVEIPAIGHDWSGSWTAYDADNHAKECQRCDEMQYEAHADANKDNYCDVCQAPLALRHVPQQDPTCTDIGYEEYWISDLTGRKFADEAGTEPITNPAQIPALGHDLGTPEAQANAHKYSCSRCSFTKSEKHTNKVNGCYCDKCGAFISGHKFVYQEGIEPTCTKPGVKDAIVCSCGIIRDAETGDVVKSPVEIPALGHDWENEWHDDAREGGHSKSCTRKGCKETINAEHNLEVEDLYSGNLHQYVCTNCDFVETEIHYDEDGDSLCDECGHSNSKVIPESKLDNPKETITIKGKKNDTTEQKKSSWWKSFWDKMNPSYVGEAESSSAPSASTGSSVGGSGTSSGSSSVSGSGSSSSSSTGSSAIEALIQYLAELLASLLG